MLNKKEFVAILIITLILAFTISLVETLEKFIYIFISVFLIIMINTLGKKIISFYLDSDIEIKLWEIKKWGVKAHYHLKKAFPAGAFLPIITTAIFLGSLTWMACLVFEVHPKIYRAAKRHGLYSFSEMTEFHIGFIAAAGIVANLILAIIAYLIGFPEAMNFVKLSIFYTFFNMLPISNLDGNKIFFGNLVIWSFLSAIVLIGLGYVFLIV